MDVGGDTLREQDPPHCSLSSQRMASKFHKVVLQLNDGFDTCVTTLEFDRDQIATTSSPHFPAQEIDTSATAQLELALPHLERIQRRYLSDNAFHQIDQLALAAKPNLSRGEGLRRESYGLGQECGLSRQWPVSVDPRARDDGLEAIEKRLR